MANVVIVAIPEQDDYVWKISSEKVPHMTLLYLGEQEVGAKLASIESYLSHAVATMLTKFGMSVERRGTLGPQDADVLFFDKSYCDHRLKDFMAALLKDPDILDMYNTVPNQYPDWTPHLTLGYPATPANPDERDYPGIHWVNFDKIALWVTDFDGPTIELKSHDDLAFDVAHEIGELLGSSLTSMLVKTPDDAVQLSLNRIFDESKVKRGMGGKFATKAGGTVARPAVGEVTDVKNDADWSKPGQQVRIDSAVLIKSAPAFVKMTDKLVKKYGVKKLSDLQGNTKALQEFINNSVTIYNTAASKVKSATSPSGDLHVQYYYDAASKRVRTRIVPTGAQHDNLDGVTLESMIDVNPEDAVQFGVRGMKWGVLRARGANGRVSGTAPAANLHKISDEDLRRLTERINLETNYRNAVINRKTKLDSAHAKVKKTLDFGQTVNKAITFGGSNAGQLLLTQVSPQFASKAFNASKISKNLQDVQDALNPNSKANQKKNKNK